MRKERYEVARRGGEEVWAAARVAGERSIGAAGRWRRDVRERTGGGLRSEDHQQGDGEPEVAARGRHSLSRGDQAPGMYRH